VLDSTTCEPIPGAVLDVWQGGSAGYYPIAVANENHPHGSCRGWLEANDEDGAFTIRTQRPGNYGLSFGYALTTWFDLPPFFSAHIHVAVKAEGYKVLCTEIQFDDDPVIDNDFRYKLQPDRKYPNAFASVQKDGIASFDFVLEPVTTDDEMELSKKSMVEQLTHRFCLGAGFDIGQSHMLCRPDLVAIVDPFLVFTTLTLYVIPLLVLFVVGFFLFRVKRLLTSTAPPSKKKNE
jgi:hypothetical protein